MIEVGDSQFYLLGGMNYETVSDISKLTINSSYQDHIRVQWKQVEYQGDDKARPLMMGSAGVHGGKIYWFGGSQMYNRKL